MAKRIYAQSLLRVTVIALSSDNGDYPCIPIFETDYLE